MSDLSNIEFLIGFPHRVDTAQRAQQFVKAGWRDCVVGAMNIPSLIEITVTIEDPSFINAALLNLQNFMTRNMPEATILEIRNKEFTENEVRPQDPGVVIIYTETGDI